ncbi:MAG: Hsp20 family protein [Caedimonas sp.]|jgi:molecular chaperone IbpA|nr:Hsp20 family protein [Caedimonas sp.]
MRSYDLTPLFRSSIGFDRLMRLMDTSLRSDESSSSSYPPYNIEKLNEETYRLTMAVAGFKEDALMITVHDNVLVVAGKACMDDENVQYLYRGIAGRAFERQFQLADFIKVGEAALENGLLRITLHREIPEAMKPRTIEISKKSSPVKNKLIEHENK